MDKMEYIKIPLYGWRGEGKYVLVDGDYDGEYFSQYRWYLMPNGYAGRSMLPDERIGKSSGYIYLHHEVCVVTPAKPWRDHINRNKLDNRSCNLRAVTPKENAANRPMYTQKFPSRGKFGFYGVSQRSRNKTGRNIKDKYIATHSSKYLGAFLTPEEAAKSRDDYVWKLHGSNGVYNFPR